MDIDIEYQLGYRISVAISNITCDIEYQLGYRISVAISNISWDIEWGDIGYEPLGNIGYQLEFRYRISARFSLLKMEVDKDISLRGISNISWGLGGLSGKCSTRFSLWGGNQGLLDLWKGKIKSFWTSFSFWGEIKVCSTSFLSWGGNQGLLDLWRRKIKFFSPSFSFWEGEIKFCSTDFPFWGEIKGLLEFCSTTFPFCGVK